MHPRSILIAVFLAVMPLAALAQSHCAVQDKSDLDPPSIRSAPYGTRNVPAEAACVAQPLRFREIILAPSQRLFGLLALGDVHRNTHEFADIAGLVEYRMTCSVHVLRRSVGKSDSEMHIEVFPRVVCAF